MGYFKIIVPEATTNLLSDTQFATADPDTIWTFAGDGTEDFTRVTTDCWVGTGCASTDLGGGTYADIYQAVTVTATSYTLSAYIKRAAAGAVSATQVAPFWDSGASTWDSITQVDDNWYYCVKTGTPTAGSRNFGVRAKEAGLLIDGVQLENKAYATTYCDGSLTGNRSDGYDFTGADHASTSTRHALERSGGRVRDIDDDLSATVNYWAGWGMIDPAHKVSDFALSPGGAYEGTKYSSRLLDLGLTFKATSIDNLHTRRQALIDAIKLDLVKPRQPFRFRYVNGEKTAEIDALYAGGLPGGQLNKVIEKAGLRLLCPDPYWQSPNDHVKTLSVSASTTFNRLIRRTGAASWDDMNGGIDDASTSVYAVAENSTDIYVGGSFVTLGATTYNYIARYNKAGDSWNVLGAGPGLSAEVRALAWDETNGLLYVGGLFQNVAGGTTDYIVKYNPGTDTFAAMGGGVSGGEVYALLVTGGKLYVGGNFTSVDGGTLGNARSVAVWDESTDTWATMPAGNVANSGLISGIVYGFAAGLDGNTIWAVGDFVGYVNGSLSTTNSYGICKYTISTDLWSTVSTNGMSAKAYSVAIDDDGVVWIGCDQTSGSRGSAVVNGLAKWDEVAFTNYNVGTSSEIVYAVAWDSTLERLYIGGNFSTVDGDGDFDYVAYLDSGGQWNDPEIDLGSISTTIRAISNYNDASLVFGFDGTGALNLPTSTAVTYNGKSEGFPTLIIVGPGAVNNITNITTDKKIDFNGLTLLTGETMTLILQPGRRRIYSSLRPDLFYTVQKRSDWAEFSLLGGDNTISVQIASTCTAYLVWRNRYESADGTA